ncbi:MAG: VCBS repeat-containing protein, partial [Bacteroidetes bacterium]|nr:VCBS repeat-containing protein [Bacteroidota bacterium]
MVWTAEGQEPSSPQLVWQTGSNGALPDSIDQIKNVKAGVDMDGDGKKEFMVPVRHLEDGVLRRSIFVFENTGDDAYEAVWSYTFPGAADQFVTLEVSDLDGDGNQEILAVHIPAGTDNASVLFVFENKGDNDYGTE